MTDRVRPWNSAETLIVTELELADALFELRLSARDAAAAGVVSDGDAQRFVAELERAAAAGRFFGAVTGFAVTMNYGPDLGDWAPWFGVIAAALAGAASSMLFAVLVLTLGSNQVATGLALAIFGIGLSSLIGASYVGMIGSKRKIRLIHDDLLHRGLTAEVLERVHAPLGFAIGSQTVPEIAISIVAELIACRNLACTSGSRSSGTSAPASLIR